MKRSEKEDAVASLRDMFSKANAAFMTEYRGMTVDQIYGLRKKVKAANGDLKVVKNRLAKIASKGTAYEHLASSFKGPIAVAFSFKDAVGIAKAVDESISDTSPLKIKSASLEGKAMDAAAVKSLSKLPSKEVLLATLLGTVRAPIQNFASLMAAVPRDFVNVLSALKDQKAKAS